LGGSRRCPSALASRRTTIKQKSGLQPSLIHFWQCAGAPASIMLPTAIGPKASITCRASWNASLLLTATGATLHDAKTDTCAQRHHFVRAHRTSRCEVRDTSPVKRLADRYDGTCGVGEGQRNPRPGKPRPRLYGHYSGVLFVTCRILNCLLEQFDRLFLQR
jgi:hypothetical protein